MFPTAPGRLPQVHRQADRNEVGHNLNLNHDGQLVPGSTTIEYYNGSGSGETGWAPIMGVGYYRDLTQWSRGEYLNPTRPGENGPVDHPGVSRLSSR